MDSEVSVYMHIFIFLYFSIVKEENVRLREYLENMGGFGRERKGNDVIQYSYTKNFKT